MKIKWISDTKRSVIETRELINLEYELRKDILKLLLKHPSLDCGDDFRYYTFNYNIETGKLSVSKTTPEPFYSKLKKVIKMNPEFSELFGSSYDF